LPTKVWIAGDYGYIIDNDGNKVDIVDVRNPAATAHLATLTPADPAKDIIARGKYLYVLVGSNGAIEVTDVSDPTSPKYIGSVSTINNDPLAMAIQNNFIVTVDATNDALEVFNLDDPAVPVFDGSVALTDGDVTDVDVQGRYAYVVGGTYLEVIDLGDSTVPTSITTFNLARPATSIKVYGGYAYVGNDQGVQIINIHDVGSPFHYESYESDPTFDLQVVGRLMYVVNNTPKLEIWDNGSAYLQQLEAGSVEVSTLAVRKNFEANEGVFKGGLTVAGTLNLEGGFALSGSGTSNYLPIWTGATTIGNSEITQASGVLSLLNGTSNRITWGTNGVAVPGTNSAGNKLTLYGSNVAASYSIGVENGFMWFSNDQTVAGTGFKWYAAGATEVFRVAGNSRVGILLSGNPSYELSLGGNVAKTIGMERHTTSNTAGTSLTINSGGATSGATNKASGDLNLNTGIGTGNSTPARVYVKTPTISGTSGTTDQTLIDRAVFANYKTLTSGVATTLFQVGTATNGTQAGGIIFYTISVTDGTDFITESGIVGYTNNNKAGVYTGATSILGTAAVSKSDATDTIVTTFGMSSDNLQCTSTITGQTPTTFRITFNIFNNANQTSTPP
jgi:hypothetical protein